MPISPGIRNSMPDERWSGLNSPSGDCAGFPDQAGKFRNGIVRIYEKSTSATIASFTEFEPNRSKFWPSSTPRAACLNSTRTIESVAARHVRRKHRQCRPCPRTARPVRRIPRLPPRFGPQGQPRNHAHRRTHPASPLPSSNKVPPELIARDPALKIRGESD